MEAGDGVMKTFYQTYIKKARVKSTGELVLVYKTGKLWSLYSNEDTLLKSLNNKWNDDEIEFIN